jgi:hypothetical protein
VDPSGCRARGASGTGRPGPRPISGRSGAAKLALMVVPVTAAALLAVPAPMGVADSSQHAAITITSNAGFVSCHCVTAGTGTAADPYIIGPCTITSPSDG